MPSGHDVSHWIVDGVYQVLRYARISDKAADEKHIGHGPDIEPYLPTEERSDTLEAPSEPDCAKDERDKTQERQDNAERAQQ